MSDLPRWIRDWADVKGEYDHDEGFEEFREAAIKLERFEALQREVANYLDKPGCNVRKQAAAMRRLRWALEKSGEPPR